MTHDGALIVFARAPRPGRVKTRLARSIGAGAAAGVYTRLLDRTLANADASPFAGRYLYCSEPGECGYFRSRLQSGRWRVAAQSAGDIGERMFAAFAAVLRTARFAVLIGSDIADFTPGDLTEAHAILERDQRDAVLGPVADGGYWLLGLGEVQQEMFADIPWSTRDVARLTAARLRTGARTVHCLPVRHDVDVAADLAILDES